jgi:hypothetical protein
VAGRTSRCHSSMVLRWVTLLVQRLAGLQWDSQGRFHMVGLLQQSWCNKRMLCSRPCLRFCCQQERSRGRAVVSGQRTVCGEDRGSLVLCRKRQVWGDGLCGDMGLCRWQDTAPVMFSAFASYSKGCTPHTAGTRGVREVLPCSFMEGR